MSKFYQLIRDMLIAIFGGFTGAILSEFAQGRMIGINAFITIIGYAVITLLIILIWAFLKKPKEKEQF